MSAPSPSWYDLLGVDQDASTDEIRAAWKTGIADLDPGDRRFRLMNQAAEVLLDEGERAAYDASLAPDPVTETETEAETETEDTSPGLETGAGAPSSTAGGFEARELAPQPASGQRRRVPGWVVAALGALALALVATCLWAWQTRPPTDEQIAEATADAQAAAERGIVAIVSYDYRSLDDDQAEASSYMTDEFKKDYEALFELIRQNAPETKTILSTEVVSSSIVRSGDDRVQIFMFINNPTLRLDITEPEVQKNQVTVTMEKVGDEWLVDDLKTTLPS